jgi:hypothetical protein
LASTGKNGWLFAEPIVLLSLLFTVVVWLSLWNSPIYTLLIFSTFVPIIPSVAAVSFAIWKYRNKVSNRALIGSVALSCYSSLEFAFPGSWGPAGVPAILIPLFLMMGSLYWLNASADRKRLVNN